MAKRRVTKAAGYRFLGGAHIHGVPARDLSNAEYDRYAAIIEKQQAISGQVLYEPVTDSAAKNEEV